MEHLLDEWPVHRLVQKFPGYGTLVDWQTRLSIVDLANACDAVDAMMEAEAAATPQQADPFKDGNWR